MAKKTAKANAEKPMAIEWVAIVQLIMQIIEALMKNKKQADDVRGQLTEAARDYGGVPDPEKRVAVTNVLRRALDDTPRVRPFRRSLLRWTLEEVPPVADQPKPKLSAAVLSEGKQLAAKSD